MKTLFPCALLAVLMSLTSCNSQTSGLDSHLTSDTKAFVKQLNREAKEEVAPFRYRIASDGYFIEKYASTDYDEILKEVDAAPRRNSLANDDLQLGIYEKISDHEVKNGRPPLPDIAETRVLRARNGYYREAWIIVNNGAVKEYLVTYRPVQFGGTQGSIYPL